MHAARTNPASRASGRITLTAGLGTHLARQIRDRAYRFQCAATFEHPQGKHADSRDLLQLLLLGARRGDVLSLHCTGTDARAAYTAFADILSEARPVRG